MTDNTEKKLSRRDAMKLLAAAVGAATVANLPPEWSKPDLEAGVLPAHAQTSIMYGLTCDADSDLDSNVEQLPITVTSGVTIAPPASGIIMRYTLVLCSAGGGINTPAPLSGTATTDASGYASVDVEYYDFWDGDSFTVTWEFENASDGTGTCQQIFAVPIRVLN